MLPQDPYILVSYVNTQLRDFYPNLDEMCAALLIKKEELIDKLTGIDYQYDKANNQFI